MRKFVVAALASLVLCASLQTSQARPATNLLDGLRADLAGRAAALEGDSDPAKQIQRSTLLAAIKNIDKDKSESILDDLKILKKVAAKIEFVFGANDPSLVTSFNGFFNTFTTTVDGVALQLQGGLFDSTAQHELEGIVSSARASLASIAMPPSDINTIKDRAGALRGVGKVAAAAVSKARKAAKAICARGGVVRATVTADGSAAVPFAPPFVAGTWTHDGTEAGPVVSVTINGFYYDRKRVADDPYHKGYVTAFFPNNVFHGVGVYDTVFNAGPNVISLTYYSEGTFYDAASGTFTVTSYDLATKDIQGTFSAVLVPFEEGVPSVTITNGAFRLCDWHDEISAQ